MAPHAATHHQWNMAGAGMGPVGGGRTAVIDRGPRHVTATPGRFAQDENSGKWREGGGGEEAVGVARIT